MTARRLRLAAWIPGALLALVLATPALAHADLVSSSPKDGDELEVGPATITLRFSEGLSASRSSFRLIGPAGDVDTGSAARDGATVMSLDVPALGPGEYTVKWTSASEDGHIERGTFSFTMVGAAASPPPASAAPSSADSPSVPPASQAPGTGIPATTVPSASPSPTAPPAAPAAATGTDVLIPIVVALLLVGGVGAFVLRRGRRS